uniref:Ankyrin repeat domain 35 n=1 Tax=Pelodiscus sinensis TaxID=13735 RepID=K7FE61_PELSI
MKKMFSCSTSQVAVESWNKQDQKLFEAVEKGDVGRVSVLASRKTARPTKLNALGQSAFHLAASKGLTECLTLLLSHGAEVNQTNDDGSTALHLATIACQPQCVKVLLQHGANEDCVDGENRTPLHWAASSGCASSVLLLCDHEAFLDVTDNNGRTPLMIAAMGNHPAICCQLLQRGASGNLTDKDQKTALILACESISVESAELLVSSGVDLSVVDRMGHDALHYALQSQSRPLRRLLRSALKKRKRRGEDGAYLDLGAEMSLPPPQFGSAKKPASASEEGDWDEEEDLDAEEWRCRCEDEQMKVLQLEEQLATKAKECDALAEGRKVMKERIWDQVQEISQLLWSGQMKSRRYSRDATEEDYYLNLLSEQVQELKKRKQEAGSEVATALEEKENATKRVVEIEGHLENMRDEEGMCQSPGGEGRGPRRNAELEGDNQRLRGLLAKQQGESQKAGKQEVDQREPRSALCTELGPFLSWMRKACARAQEEKAAVLAENEDLKREAEEALRGKFHLEAVPSEAVRQSMASWEKMVMGLEHALAKMGEANSNLLEKARPLQEAISAPHSKQEPGVVEQLTPRLRDNSEETKGRARRRSSDLEKEVSDLRENNGSLLNELAQLGMEREKLQEELQRLQQHPEKEGSPRAEAQDVVEELRQRVAALSQELSAEKEETKKLRLRLETQKREMVVLRDSFLKQMMGEANKVQSQSLGACILEELHWKLDNLVKKHNEALQLVSEIEEESQMLESDQTPAVQLGGELVLEPWRWVNELERDLWELKEELEAAQATLGSEGHDMTKLKQLLDRLPVKVAELCSEEEEALRMHEKAWSSLALQTQALEEELRALQEKHEEVREKSAQREEVLASERQKNKDLLDKVAELEKEAREPRRKSEQLQRTIKDLNKKVEELSRTCQDKEGKIKKLLKETEKLSAEILTLRSESARLQLQLEVKEKNHQEIVTIYRTHLLNAAQGFMDEDVHSMLLRILRAKEE